jgi:hypothetical protein
MLRRLEREGIRADLAAVESLLGIRTEQEDPVGWLQFSQRKAMLEEQLAQAADDLSTSAAVGLFFGGRPVLGSRGIAADFGAKALEQFQAVVATKHAAQEGPVGSRGPVAQRDRSQLMITDVARGSFGFVLEEVDGEQLVDTPLRHTLDEVIDAIYRVSAPDEEAFEAVIEAVDNRVLNSLRSFFKLIDDAGATMRIVEEQRDFTLLRDAVERARERTESLEITDDEKRVEGVLYVLPESRKFELHPIGGQQTIRGAVAPDCIRAIAPDGHEIPQGIIGTVHPVTLKVREVRAANRAPRYSYTLVRVD